MTKRPLPLAGPWALGALFAVGLAVRLPGLLFNGMDDLEQMIFQWGTAVKELGLGAAFHENYGILSYSLFGLAAGLGEQMARFWWVPYKLMELSFEIGVLIALYLLLPKGRRHWALLLYWLNPLFILYGAWQGFWEGPHILFGLIAVLCLKWVQNERWAWTLVGALLMTSAMFKPQGLLYFVIPVGLYLGVQFLWQRRLQLVWFILGATLVTVFATGFLVLNGGDVLGIPKNYVTAVNVMPNLCNDCVNVWRPVTRGIQAIWRWGGPTYTLVLPRRYAIPLHTSATLVTLALILLLSLRLAGPGRRLRWRFWGTSANAEIVPGTMQNSNALSPTGQDPLSLWERVRVRAIPSLGKIRLAQSASWGRAHPGRSASGGQDATAGKVSKGKGESSLTRHLLEALLGAGPKTDLAPNLKVLLVLAFASLVISQLGTKAHINHTYTALVLLIPLALGNRRVFWPWVTMAAIVLYGNLATDQLGRAGVLPQYYTNFGPAQPLLSHIYGALATTPYPWLLEFQSGVNQFLTRYLSPEPALSLLSVVQLACTLLIVYEVLSETSRDRSLSPTTASPLRWRVPWRAPDRLP